MYIQNNTKLCSCKHCCSGKSNKYYIFWVYSCSLKYPARNRHAPYYNVICDLSGCTTLFHIFPQTARFFGK